MWTNTKNTKYTKYHKKGGNYNIGEHPTTRKSEGQYTREFVISANEVPRFIGPPSYAGTVQPIQEAAIMNLIRMVVSQDPAWEMLLCIQEKPYRG